MTWDSSSKCHTTNKQPAALYALCTGSFIETREQNRILGKNVAKLWKNFKQKQQSLGTYTIILGQVKLNHKHLLHLYITATFSDWKNSGGKGGGGYKEKNLENRPSAFIRGKEYGVFRIPKILHCYGVKIKLFSLKSVTIALDPYWG